MEGLYQNNGLFTSLSAGNYAIVVTGINQCNDTILATVGVQVGLAEISSDDVLISLKPNPVSELLHLEIQS